MNNTEVVTLKCVNINNKLRVRVHNNPNYHPDINCSFPRDMRMEGRFFTIQGPLGISNTKTTFYRALNKWSIKIIESPVEEGKFNKVYASEDNECVICMSEEKSIIFMPCGHYYVCGVCSLRIKHCPICRTRITNTIKNSELKLD